MSTNPKEDCPSSTPTPRRLASVDFHGLLKRSPRILGEVDYYSGGIANFHHCSMASSLRNVDFGEQDVLCSH